MLITDRLVFVHLPKTGGTFVVTAIARYYGSFFTGTIRSFESNPPGPDSTFCFRSRFKHLGRHHIPVSCARLPLLGTVRNPYSRYVSQYRFGTWRSRPEQYPGISDFPNFPDVSFPDFVRLANEHLWLVSQKSLFRSQDIGWQTATLFHWYGRHDLLMDHARDSTAESISVESLREILDPIILIPMENLRDGLVSALASVGYKREQLSFIREMPAVYPTPESSSEDENAPFDHRAESPAGAAHRPADDPENDTAAHRHEQWLEYYDQETLEYVNRKERWFFSLFPQWYALTETVT